MGEIEDLEITGIKLVTFSVQSRCSTTELYPRYHKQHPRLTHSLRIFRRATHYLPLRQSRNVTNHQIKNCYIHKYATIQHSSFGNRENFHPCPHAICGLDSSTGRGTFGASVQPGVVSPSKKCTGWISLILPFIGWYFQRPTRL